MTVGEKLRRRRRYLNIAAGAGMGLFAAAILFDAVLKLGDWIWVPGFIGFGIAWLTGMGSYFFAFRCPECRANLAALFLNNMTWRPAKFCAYCGTDLDTIEIDE